MSYLKSLIINFLAVFFINHVIPDVEIDYYSKLPHIGGDIIFSLALGFANSLIYPIIVLFRVKPTHFKVGLSSFFICFGAYSIVNLLPVGIKVTSAVAYIWCAVIIWLISYLTNHLELRRYIKAKEKREEELHRDHYEEEEEHEDDEETHKDDE